MGRVGLHVSVPAWIAARDGHCLDTTVDEYGGTVVSALRSALMCLVSVIV